MPGSDSSGLVRRATSSADFLAGYVPASRHLELARTLALGEGRLRQLLLCRPPRPDQFVADTVAIARLVGTAPAALARALREQVALSALGQYEGEAAEMAGLLRAARDIESESYGRSKDMARIATLVAEIDRLAESVDGERDVATLVAWQSPVAVVFLPRLTLQRSIDWLAGHDVRVGLDRTDRAIRGLLVAWRGSGLIFVDGSLPRAERDLTIAHEWGHFLLDYHAPRARVLDIAPALLDVVDNYRSPTREDRIDAVLSNVPVGLHTHLLDRDEAGGPASDVALREDNATAFALELLAPWERVLATLRAMRLGSLPFEQRVAVAADELASRFGLPQEAADLRARAALRAIGQHRGFFEQ